MVTVKFITPKSTVEQYVLRGVDKFKDEILDNLNLVGEECINTARANGDYNDITGNLRSSIGYRTVKNGNMIMEAISESSNGTDKATGVAAGRAFMEELTSKIDTGLIVVAGMNYASAVASGRRKTRNGRYYNVSARDVLDSAELTADKMVKEMVQAYE